MVAPTVLTEMVAIRGQEVSLVASAQVPVAILQRADLVPAVPDAAATVVVAVVVTPVAKADAWLEAVVRTTRAKQPRVWLVPERETAWSRFRPML